jgi:hypothetical protein
LLFLDKGGCDECQYVKVDDLSAWSINGQASEGTIPAISINASDWNFTIGKGTALFERLNHMPIKLGEVAHTFVGTQTSADDVFVLDECRQLNSFTIGISKSLGKEVKVESNCVVPFLRGKEIRRYEPPIASDSLICPYEISESSCRLFTPSEMSSKFPFTLTYLEANKEILMAREKGKFKGPNWYAYGYPKSMTLFQKSKIIVPDYNNIASFTFDSGGHFYKTGYGILVKNESLSPLYVLGLLNSPLLFKYLKSIGTSLRGGYIRFWTKFIEQLPIRAIDFSNPSDNSIHSRVVTLVEQILKLHKELVNAKSEAHRTVTQRQIDSTDHEINWLVYELYGLTEKEIAIIEEK